MDQPPFAIHFSATRASAPASSKQRTTSLKPFSEAMHSAVFPRTVVLVAATATKGWTMETGPWKNDEFMDFLWIFSGFL